MPAFNFHRCLAASRLDEARQLPTRVAAPGERLAVEFAFDDAPESLATCVSFLKAHDVQLLAVALAWDVRRATSEASVAPWISAIAENCDLLLLRLVSSDVHDKPSAPRAMPAAGELLRLASKIAGPGVRIALTPRPGAWLCDEHDSVRLAMRVNRGNVGVALNWNVGRDGRAPSADLLRLVEPKLMAVICQAQGSPETDADAAAPHATGDFTALNRIGYRGPIFVRFDDDAS